jgi:hypothetical protein
MQTVSSYEKVQVDKALLMEAVKGGVLGAGTVFATDFLLSKFVHNGKIRAALCAAAPVALAMWLKEKNPELATAMAVGGAGAGIYKLIQAFLYERLNIPYAGGEFYDQYGILEEVPAEEEAYVVTEQAQAQPQQGYGMLTEIPAEEGTYVVETPEEQGYAGVYGTSLV